MKYTLTLGCILADYNFGSDVLNQLITTRMNMSAYLFISLLKSRFMILEPILLFILSTTDIYRLTSSPLPLLLLYWHPHLLSTGRLPQQ